MELDTAIIKWHCDKPKEQSLNWPQIGLNAQPMKLPIIDQQKVESQGQDKVTFLFYLTFEDGSFRPFNLEVQFFEV